MVRPLCRSSSFCSAAMAGGLGDVRKLFLFTTTQNYFGMRPELWDQPPLSNCPEVNNFLDDGNQMLLRVQRSDSGVAFSNEVWRLPGVACPGCPGPAWLSLLQPQVIILGLKTASALYCGLSPPWVVECPPESRSFLVHRWE